ncbi:MAG TPA: hypothetical protein VFQ44_14930 [Streptosporangiaceae bacterium]|nr:hypothetical protein [Streptosporangiaceae bacterium]
MNAHVRVLRARYAWHQSDHPVVLGVRAMINSRLLPFVSTASQAGPDLPSLGYAGVPHGLGKVLQTLEARREAAGAVTTATEQVKVRRADLFDGALPATDLVAVGCSPAQASALPLRSALVLPFRMHFVVDLSRGQDEWRRAISRRERQWFSARRKERGWALEIAADEDAFRFFYHQMHLPTMRSRHGERTRSEPEDSALECLFRSGVLAFATANGERLAGALCRRSKDDATITIRLLGVLNGASEMYEIGALKAVYHLLLEWADGHGFRQVDLGGTEAWLSPGLFQWKRRFAPKIVLAPNHLGRLRVWFHARRDTAPVRDFLVANPVLEITGDQEFGAVYFHDDDRPARFDLAYACPNVRKHRTVHLDDFLPARSAS